MPKIINPQIKLQIVELSQYKTLTQIEIAKELGVSRSTVKIVMTGKKPKRNVVPRQPKDMWDCCPITGYNSH